MANQFDQQIASLLNDSNQKIEALALLSNRNNLYLTNIAKITLKARKLIEQRRRAQNLVGELRGKLQKMGVERKQAISDAQRLRRTIQQTEADGCAIRNRLGQQERELIELRKEKDQLEKEKVVLKDEISNMEKELKRVRSEGDASRARLRTLEEQLKKKTGIQSLVSNRVSAIKEEERQTKIALERLRAKLRDEQQKLAQQFEQLKQNEITMKRIIDRIKELNTKLDTVIAQATENDRKVNAALTELNQIFDGIGPNQGMTEGARTPEWLRSAASQLESTRGGSNYTKRGGWRHQKSSRTSFRKRHRRGSKRRKQKV